MSDNHFSSSQRPSNSNLNPRRGNKGRSGAEKQSPIGANPPAQPPSFRANIPFKFNLERSFAAVPITLDKLRASKDLHTTYALSKELSVAVHAALHTIDGLPAQVRADQSYELHRFAVTFTDALFLSHVTKIPARRTSTSSEEVASIISDFASVYVGTLRTFLSTAERIFLDVKPLPALPRNVTSPSEEKPASSLSIILRDALNGRNDSSSDNSSLRSSHSSIKTSNWRTRVIRRILRRRNKATAKQELSSTPYKLTPARNFQIEIQRLFRTAQSSGRNNVPDPPHEVCGKMPSQVNGHSGTLFNENGTIKAATIPALVCLLTSKEVVFDADFVPAFFLSFRLFMTPTQLFERLSQRFQELPPSSLSSQELQKWARDAPITRILVGRTILFWLTVYWRHDLDSAVFEPLQDLALARLGSELPESLAIQILEALDGVGRENIERRGSQKASDLRDMYRDGHVPLPSTEFKMLFGPTSDPLAQLLSFNSTTGREEFARQVTLMVSRLFQQVDPEDAIAFWFTNKVSDAGRTLRSIVLFQRATAQWVSKTVLDCSAIHGRVQLLEFFLDIATRCLRLRNFGSAHAFFLGVAHSAISRMKQTVLRVGMFSKRQYQALNDFFDGHNNFSAYREAIPPTEPTVPFLAPFQRDIMSLKEIVENTERKTKDGKQTVVNFQAFRVVMRTVQAMQGGLIAYDCLCSDEFAQWYQSHLKKCPKEQEEKTNDALYRISSIREPKESLLNHINHPWKYFLSGPFPKDYKLCPIAGNDLEP